MCISGREVERLAVQPLQNREARRVRVEVLRVVVRRRVDQVPDGRGRQQDGDRARPAGDHPARGHREDDRRDVDQVSLLDSDREVRREVRRLHGGVQTERDDRSDEGRGERAFVGQAPPGTEQPRQRDEDRQNADADHEGAGRPEPVREQAVMEVGADLPGVGVLVGEGSEHDQHTEDEDDRTDSLTHRPAADQAFGRGCRSPP